MVPNGTVQDSVAESCSRHSKPSPSEAARQLPTPPAKPAGELTAIAALLLFDTNDQGVRCILVKGGLELIFASFDQMCEFVLQRGTDR